MKHTMKRALALLIAALLALPLQGIALSEEAFDVVIDDAAIDDLAIDDELDIEDIDSPVEEIGDLLLEDLNLGDLELEAPDPQLVDSNGTAPAAPAPFEQSVAVDGVTFTVTAVAGAFPADSVLRIDRVKDRETEDAARKAAEAAVQGDLSHYLYGIEVLDAAGNPCMPGGDAELPTVTVTGLDISGDTRVIMYDQNIGGYSEIKAEKDAGGLIFHFVGSAIYDIAEMTSTAQETGTTDGQAGSDRSADEQQSTDEQQTTDVQQPADEQQPAEEDSAQPADEESEQPTDENSEQPADEESEQPADEESEQTVGEESAQPTDEESEQTVGEESAQPANDESEQPADEQQPADEESEQPADEESEQPADEESARPVDDESAQLADEESAQSADEESEQPADGESPQPADEQQPVGGESTQPADEESTQPDDGESPQPTGEESAQPVDGESTQPADEESEQPTDDESCQPTDEESEQPTDEESTQPADEESAQPADGESVQPADDESTQTADEESEQPANIESPQPADEESAQPTDEESTQPADEEQTQPADGQTVDEQIDGQQPAEEVSPVRVVFNTMPETAVLTVYASYNDKSEAGTAEPLIALEDGAYLLLPGEYTYSASSEGYKPVEGVFFTVADTPLEIDVELETEEAEVAEPVPFDQSMTVNGIAVRVQAGTGAFPAGAELSVKQVPVYKERQAENAIDGVRDDDVNVAVSYTFDIKVLDPETGAELQPAEGFAVEVSFALSEAADGNLSASVYHITGENGDLTAEALDTEAEGETVTATTDGFSLYTVEFTYNALEYVLEGGRSVALSEILGKLGLTGTPTAVAVSDSALFDATREGGQWVVAAKKPFSSPEWMKVTIGEVVYDITVTDDQEYDLWVGGVQVTSANLNDILGDGTNVKYEPDTKTLTFPANITVSGTNGIGIIYNGIPGLKIKAPKGLELNDSNVSYGIVGSSFSIDTEKNTLTIKAKSYGISTTDVTVDGNLDITVGYQGIMNSGAVTVNGGVTIHSPKADYGIDAYGDVTLTGDIDIQVSGFPIGTVSNMSLNYGTCKLTSQKRFVVSNGNATLTGDSFTAVTTADYDSLQVEGKLTLVRGKFSLTGKMRAINAYKGGDIEIQSGVTRVYAESTSTSYGAIVSYGGKITLADNLRIVTPEDGYVLTDTTSSMIVDEDGNKAPEVEILPGKAVTVASATNGKVTADPAYALNGETVTLTVKPDDNYALAALSVSDGTNTIGTTKVNDTTYTFTMPDAPVTVTANFAPAHKHGDITFQPTDKLPSNPGDYYLTADVETTGSWVLPNGTVRLCLNGHKIDTGEKRIKVNEGQTLEIYDDDRLNGIITCTDAYTIDVSGGAFALHGGTLQGPGSGAGGGTKFGVGLYSPGSFTMDGGTITGYNAYGVYTNNGTFTLSGGSIVDNAVGGIDIDCYCSFFLSGAPDFSSTANAGADIYFNNARGDALVTVDGTLTKPDNKIRVSMKYPGVFTKNWKTKMGENADPADYFVSDSIRYGVRLTDGGEAELYQRKEWAALQEDITAAGTTAKTFTLSNYDFDGDKTIKAEATDGPLTIGDGQTIRLDLNGCALNRGLTQAKDDGNAVTVNGTLTVTDGAGGGVITGGRNKGNGGGVIVNDTFNMQGGTVTGNSALNDGNGGGVYLNGGTLTLSDSATISGNSARHGGGVYMGGGAFKMSGSVEISGNTTANNGDGGGVCVNGGGFEMSGGSITRNTTAGYGYGGGVCVGGGSFEMSGSANIFLNSAKRGGGVDVSSGASFTMTGGSIATNTTADNTYDGGGVYVGGTFSVSGAPNISGNVKGGKIENGALSGGTANNVFLASGWSGSKTVTVAGALSNTVKIGVSMGSLGVVTSGYPTYCVDGDGKPLAAGTYFVSDKGYTLGLNADNEVEVPQHTVSVTITGIKGADGRPSVGYKLSDGTEGTLYYWSGDTKSFTVPADMDATLTAGTLQAYSFINWEEDNTITGTDAALTISNVTANHNIIAHYLQTHIVVNAAIDGRDWQDGDAFTFNVTAVEDDAPKPPQASLEVLSTAANHSAAFGNIPFTGGMLGNTYHYKVTQAKGDIFGIAYDTEEKEVAYQVAERAGGGVIELLPSAVQEVTFTNTLVRPTVNDTDYFFGKVSNLQADVTAAAAEGFGLSYQWYSCDKDGKNRVKLDSEENQQYTLPADLGAGEHYYLCEVTGTHKTSGKATAVDSNVAKANVRPQLVTLTANSRDTDVYDGTEKTVTGFTCSVDGLKFAETVIASGKGTNAGEYQVDFSGVETHVTTDTTGNYVVDNLVFGTLTINPASVTLTANSREETYDGAEKTVAGFTCSVEGLTFDDTVTASGSGTDAGEYVVTFSGVTVNTTKDATGNYVVTGTEDGTLTINRKAVTITAKDAAKTYDGKALTEAGFTASALEAGDSHTFTVAMTDASTITDAGDVPNVIATVDGTAVASGVEKRIGNYLVTTKDGTLTVHPASATVTIAGHTNTAAYDGKAHIVSGYDVKIDNPLYREADFTFTGKAEATRTDAGKTPMGLKASQFKNMNKNFSTVTFNVTDGWQEITAIDATVTITGHTNTAGYDGKAHTVSGYDVKIDNPLYRETDFTFTGRAEASQIDAGTAKMGLAASQFANTNPNFDQVTFTVTDGYQEITTIDAIVTITGNTNTAVYNGKEHGVTGYTAKANTALYDVTKDFTFSGRAEASRTDAGTAKMGLNASQFKNTNKNFATVTFNVTDGWQEITPAAITITADDKASRFGAELLPMTYAVGGAYVEGDDLGVTLTTAATSSSGVGTYPITVAWNKNPNYTAELTDGTYTITKGDLTVTASGYSSVYDGKAHSITVTAEGTGVAIYYGTEKLTASNYTTAGSTKPVTRTDAGKTTVYYYVVGDNYEAVSGSKGVNITQKSVAVVADDKTKTYGDADPKLTYKVTGLIGSDKLTGSLTRKKGEKVGTYPIRQGTLSAPANYTIAFTGATFTIKERPVKPNYTLLAVMNPVSDTSLQLAWSKVDGAQGYDVFFKVCDGKGNYPLVRTTKKLSCTIRKLKKGQAYKAYVKAWKKEKGQKVYIGKASPRVHCIAGGYNKKHCNAKKVTVKQKKLTLAKGKSKRIVANITGVKKRRDILHHAKLLRYFSSDKNVATVNANGMVNACGVGTCTIIVMASNGVCATVKVTVK